MIEYYHHHHLPNLIFLLTFTTIILSSTHYHYHCATISKAGASAKTYYPPWIFPSTFIPNMTDRPAKLGDRCLYREFLRHAQPIWKAMKLYESVKKDLLGSFKEAVKEGTTTQTDPYLYLRDVAQELYNVRKNRSDEVKAQLESGDLTQPLNIKDRNMTLLQAVCEGGELLTCVPIGETDEGICKCLTIPDVELYNMTLDTDGHCVGTAGSPCNKEDPFHSVRCLRSLQCRNFTKKECQFQFGHDYHCDGYPQGFIEDQNLFCSRYGEHPESYDHDHNVASFGQKFHFVFIVILFLVYFSTK